MIRSVRKGDVKNVSCGKIVYDPLCIIPCNSDIIACSNTIINLGVLTDDGLKVISNKIGKAIKANDDKIQIKFNTSFAFNDKLYAIIKRPGIKIPAELVLAYKEA